MPDSRTSFFLDSSIRRPPRYSTGAREHTTNVYDPKSQYPCGLIGPASFIWRPLPPPLAGKSSVSTDRTILVRVHPAIAATSVAAFENALDDTNKVKVTKHEEKFDTFEVTGQRAAEVVKAVLRPIEKTSKETKAVSRISRVFARSFALISRDCRSGLEAARPSSWPWERSRGNDLWSPSL